MKRSFYFFIVLSLAVLTDELVAGDIVFPHRLSVSGDLARRIALLERRLYKEPFTLEFTVQDVARVPGKTRRFEDYEGDVSGRVLGAWSYLSRVLGTRPGKLDTLANEILKYQSSEGYFGKDQRQEGWDLWGRQNFGHGRLLVGLVEYYKLTGDGRFLDAARKLGKYFVNTIPVWTTEYKDNPYVSLPTFNRNERGFNRSRFIRTHQTSVLEALMMLFEVTGDMDFIQSGRRILPLIPDFGHFHSHSFLNTLTGVAMLYGHTGDAALLDRLLLVYWQDILRKSWRPDGSVCEYYPLDHRTEGCSLSDWLRLNLELWVLTRDVRYLDEAERTWLNGLNFHETGEGAFGHTFLTPDGYAPEVSQAWWCCLMHGLFAYTGIVHHAVAAENDRISINFLTPLSGEIFLPEGPARTDRGQPVRFVVSTDYPETGCTVLKLDPQEPQDFEVAVRIPVWARDVKISVNDRVFNAPGKDGYRIIRREWKKGDEILVEFPVGLRIEDERGNDLLTLKSFGDLHTGYLFHGPLLLGADTRRNESLPERLDFDLANLEKYRLPVSDKNIGSYAENTVHQITGLPEGEKPESVSRNEFILPGAHYRIYGKSGGQVMDVMLVPISEFTGYNEWKPALTGFERNGEKPIMRPEVRIRQAMHIMESRAER